MKAVIYTQNNCQFTPQEKTYLTSKGVTFEERNVEANKEFLDEMMKIGANFAGTPVTQITKDDGSTAVLKGFTQTEFDAALGGGTVATANADMNVPPMPVTPPAPVEPVMPPVPETMPTPMPEPTPAPVVETPAPVVPEPVPSAPVEPVTQAANADMTMPVTPPAPVEPVKPPAPEPRPTPMPEPTPAPVVEAPAPVVPEPVPSAPVEPVTQTASNPLDAILADLQQKVSAASPAVQTANADMTMPSAPQSPVDQPVTPPAAPEPVVTTVPEPFVPQTPPASDAPAPSADLPSVPDFK